MRFVVKALPYENVKANFESLTLFISLRFIVASNSDCPPDKKAIPGTPEGTFFKII